MMISLLSLSLAVLLLTGAYNKRQTSIQSWLVINGMILSEYSSRKRSFSHLDKQEKVIYLHLGIGSIGFAVISILELLDTFAARSDILKAISLLAPMLVLRKSIDYC